MCRSCNRFCSDPFTPESPAEIECIHCGGTGKDESQKDCNGCNGTGFFELNECPRKLIGNVLTEEINMATYATKGHLPEAGGLLDQSSWFVSMWSTLNDDIARIEREVRERANR